MQHLSVKALKEKSHLYLLYAVATQNFEVYVRHSHIKCNYVIHGQN